MNFKITILQLLAFLFATSYTAQTTYSFTTAGITGSVGPTQLQVNSAYASTNLNGSVTVSGSGIQQFTVPATGIYRIIAAGSSGGGVINAFGCRGRIVQGDVLLNAGQVLKILVGQKGVTASQSTGGGGGSYVTTNTNSLLIVGGGGGGYCTALLSAAPASDGSYGNNGQNYTGTSTGGTGGTGGGGGNGAPSGWGGGGGGFTGNGTTAGSCLGTGGFSFLNGGVGGSTCYNSVGGFGGGGGTHGNTGGGGGGGGYSGGGGSGQNPSTSSGGGGGSYQSPNMTNLVDGGFNTAQGYVILTRLAGLTIVQTASVLCNGQLTAALSASATGGTAPYTYSWSTGAITSTLAGIGAGSYTCVATDAAAVTFSASYTVTEPTSLFAFLTQTNVTCNGGSNGAINLIGSGGVGPYTYNWAPFGGTASLASNLTAGSYTCTITDANACQSSVIVGVSQPTPVNVIAFATSPVVCYGQTSILIGAGAITYSWTGGATNGVPFTPTATSNYTVTGTNAIGCTGTAVTSITVNPLPALVVNGSSVICSGNTVTLDVTGANTYTWSTVSNSNSITASPLVTTVYTVSGTNSFGCQNVVTKTVTVINTNPVVAANTNSPVICAGFSTLLYGSGAASYAWSGGITDNVIFTPTVTTSYTVIGTNACGTGSAVALITVNNLPLVTANASSSAVCIGGSVTLFGGGASTYTWTGGVTNNISFVPAATANYTVSATDVNGCKNSANTSIVVNPLPSVTANVTNTVVCFGSTVIFTGGGALTYSWTGGVVDGVSYFTPVTANYTVTGTDANGCKNTAVQTVSVANIPVVSASVSNSVVCFGTTLTLNGIGADTYVWSGGATNGVPFAPPTTTVYSVVGSNLCGSASATIAVTVNALPPVTANASNTVVCIGNSLTLFGGGALTYTWTGGITNNVAFIPAISTTYSVTGTDANGCRNTASKAIVVNALPSVSASVNNSVICLGFSVTFNGAGAVTYSWTNGVINNVPYSPSVTATFTVTGTDANGCQNVAFKSVTVNPLPFVTANASGTLVCQGNATSLYGGGANTYTWAGGMINGASFFPSATASYTVSGTNTITGCTSTNVAVVSITVNPLPLITTSATPSVICFGQSTTFTAAGANTYTWSGGISNGIPFAPSTTTNYIVTATNTLTGCSNLAVQTITVNPLPLITANSSSPAICYGYPTSLFGGGASTYTWTGGITNGLAFTPTLTTTYTVSGTNTITGCNSSNSPTITITVNALPNLTISVTNSNVCHGGLTTLTAGGAGTYTWSNGVVNGVAFTPSATNVYTVVGANFATGCSNTASQSIVVSPRPVVSINSSATSVCSGNSVTLNGTGADTYTWSGGVLNGVPFVPSITNTYTLNGSYTLTGCSSTLAALQTITVNALPTVTANVSNSVICSGNTVTLFGTGADTYTWTSGVLNAIPFTPTLTNGYLVNGTSTLTGCSSTNLAMQTITVNALPVLIVTSTNSIICSGENASLSVTGANSYSWSEGSLGTSILISPVVTTTYSVIGTGTNGCSSTAVLTQSVSDCTSLHENSDVFLSVSIYPNPSNGQFTIVSDKNLSLQLLNELGEVLKEIPVKADDTNSVILTDLSKGIYVLMGTLNGHMFSRKIIIAQ